MTSRPLDLAGRETSRHTLVTVDQVLDDRNRITTFFRPVLAVPHLLLVGAPAAFGLTIGWRAFEGPRIELGTGTGVLGLVAGVCALIAWFAILFTGVYPAGLWDMAAAYLRWRVRAMSYMALLRDEFPPFGDREYPAHLVVFPPEGERNRVSTAFRLFLLIPHFIALWVLGLVWLATTLVAWLAILFTGHFPGSLYRYGVGMVRWSARVEAYLLLLHDEYPPFALD